MRHRSKLRKFAPVFATVFLLGGILLVWLAFDRRSRLFGFGLVAIGIGYVIDVLTYEGRWVRRRLRAGGSSSAQIEFHEDHIFLRTDRSAGNHRLPGFVDVTATDHGVFLYPQKDISFYIPWASIEPAEAIPKVRELLVSKGRLAAE